MLLLWRDIYENSRQIHLQSSSEAGFTPDLHLPVIRRQQNISGDALLY